MHFRPKSIVHSHLSATSSCLWFCTVLTTAAGRGMFIFSTFHLPFLSFSLLFENVIV